MREMKGARLALLMDFENLTVGLENNTPAAERPFSITEVISYLESNYGQVIYRRAFADWGNAKFRKYGADLQRAGVDMQHVVRTGINGKNAADMHLVIHAMDCLVTCPAVDVFVIVTGDADFLPLITRLKASGRVVIGLGIEGATANSLIENCDEYVYYGSHGLVPVSGHLTTTAPAMQALRRMLLEHGGDPVPVVDLAAAVARRYPDLPEELRTPEGVVQLLRSLDNAVVLRGDGGAGTAAWNIPVREPEERPALALESVPFEEYLSATRGFIREPGRRERILRDLFALLKSREETTLSLQEVRSLVDASGECSDKEWFGTVFSLTCGGCIWEDPSTSARPMPQRAVSLFRGVGTVDEFLLRYYTSLFHKAYGDRPDITPALCSGIMFPEVPERHTALFEEVFTRLAQRR